MDKQAQIDALRREMLGLLAQIMGTSSRDERRLLRAQLEDVRDRLKALIDGGDEFPQEPVVLID